MRGSFASGKPPTRKPAKKLKQPSMPLSLANTLVTPFNGFVNSTITPQ
jgi:hypothetical protein